MDVKTIQKYKKYSINQLGVIATKHFNEFIRLRDSTPMDGKYRWGQCISSGRRITVPNVNSHAGHYYSAGHHPTLRYNEDNVHLQGKSDNYFKSGNQLEYRKNLIAKIGLERVERLDALAGMGKRTNFKWDRFFLIEVIEKYKEKKKQFK